MNLQTLQMLRDADAPDAIEFPSGFNYEQSLARVEKMKPKLEKFVGLSFGIDTNVQDASYFTELYIRENKPQCVSGIGQVLYTIFAVRFSSFGNLFMIWGNSPTTQIDEIVIKKVISIVQQHGFIYVDTQSLDEPYSGESKVFKEIAGPSTWRMRFFDYI